MIEHACGLNDAALEAIAGLERRVIASDGGRLKLEWGVLRSRPSDQVRDLLWWEDGRLLGFAGLYGFNWQWLEVTGMVDPDARGRGIARALWEAALPLCHAHGAERLLMVVPRHSRPGAGLARSLGLALHHSEHALRLSAAPAPGPAEPSAEAEIELRTATLADIPVLSHLFDDGFHDGGHVDPGRLTREGTRTMLILRGGEPVGTIAAAHHGDRGSIYGFVVETRWRGQGIGGIALRRVCAELFAAGATHVELEVEVENEGALGLYTQLGFEPLTTEDYYELRPTPAAPRPTRPRTSAPGRG